jgi:hypothetical protein
MEYLESRQKSLVDRFDLDLLFQDIKNIKKKLKVGGNKVSEDVSHSHGAKEHSHNTKDHSAQK